MCHLTSTPHPCGHTSLHLLMPCRAPKFPSPASFDPFCAAPTIRHLTRAQATGYECATCLAARRAVLVEEEVNEVVQEIVNVVVEEEGAVGEEGGEGIVGPGQAGERNKENVPLGGAVDEEPQGEMAPKEA
ncbi:hypothetical protein MMC13_002474 [Lambiella insularis]|nr:hypothetical protein [Lambiella insularis]